MTNNPSKVKTVPKPDNFIPTPLMTDGGLRCRAWSPRQGRQCRNRASKATGKTCRYHGSAGGRPATHARFSLMGKLQKLAATIDDGDVFNLYSEAIVSNIRVEELLERIADEQALPSADELRKLADQAFIAGVHGDRDKCLSALTELKEALEPIKAEQESWNEIRQHLALSVRISRSERTADLQSDSMVPVLVVAQFLQIVMGTVQRYLPRDTEVRRAFAKEIRRVTETEHVIPLESIR